MTDKQFAAAHNDYLDPDRQTWTDDDEAASDDQHDPTSFAPNDTAAECALCGAKFYMAIVRARHNCPPADLAAEIDRLREVNAGLLAALERILPLYEKHLLAEGYSAEIILSGTCGKARTAIAKAKGEL